ncbi:equilibrative nucleoside transporter 1-like [Plodia interpunctella]|uniref:equilibrative nucleoside transporter 1-like n=1 Tax=Plodia interpunctella TaxID=58824 RepID=UPI0023678399|nr:equilibrative nucleoside transporter 1-like [Plodia interpunctella]XP_053619527.1 equilibrative nucleoside transporter 1-like [Plodia interpunctella]XP_053619528.1 equilibrative nucleoside transporter 1-like [Plodia interpunctella]
MVPPSLPPKDKWHLILMALMLHGLGILLPWNMFITAKDYFVKYKLVDRPDLADNYLAYVGWASQLPNVAFNWLNIFVQMGGSLTMRIICSMLLEMCIFVITIVMAMVDTSHCPTVFFSLTMISVLFLNTFNAIYHNSIFGVAARFPPKYTGVVVLGSNVCGTLVVFLDWGSTVFSSTRTAAIYYFIGGIGVLLVCFDTYYAFPINRFYRYYDTLSRGASNGAVTRRPPYLHIVKQAWVQLYNVFVTFFVALAVFPSVISEVRPVTDGFLGSNFVRLTCFFTNNFASMIGNITASLVQFPNRRWLSVFVTSRFLFIPFFLLCNYKPQDRSLPVVIGNDYLFWMGTAILGWSTGHYSSLGMMYVSGGTVPSEYASIAGMLGSAVLVTGIFCGLLFTYICPLIVRM